MKKYKLKFKGRNGFMLFAKWLEWALRDIEDNVENVLQCRLLSCVLVSLYSKSVVPQVMEHREKYSLVLNDAQAVSIAIALHNHRHSEELETHEDFILTSICTDLLEHLKKTRRQLEFPQLPTT